MVSVHRIWTDPALGLKFN